MKSLRGQNAAMASRLSIVAKSICAILGVLVLFSGVAGATPNITGFLVNGVASSTGPVGASLTIQGSGFGATRGFSTATLNGIAVAGNGVTPTSWSDTSIVVTIPTSASSGPVIVKVSGVSSNAVNFNIAALISSISASTATVGSTITITGAGFGTAGGTVTFGGAAATTSSWTNASIVAQVPNAATAGSIIVSVGSQASNGVAFTPTPVITGVSPGLGGSGTTVTITGNGFGSVAGTVTFNSASATITNWGLNSITALVPADGIGGANNVVVTMNGVASTPVAFSVTPVITGFSPASAMEGTSITITGTGFGPTWGNNSISFNGLLATPTSWSPNSIVVPVPIDAVTGAITATINGVSGTSAPFVVLPPPPPQIQQVAPVSGPVGTSVTITGAHFGNIQDTSTVKFNNVLAPVASPADWKDNQIVVLVPPGATTGNVVVRRQNVDSNPQPFTVTPAITGLNPNSGAVGDVITITGTTFGAVQGTVTFNGIDATVTSWLDGTIMAKTPCGGVTGNVIVKRADRQSSNGQPFNVALLPASVQSPALIRSTGDTSHRLEIVFLGDGYTQRDLGKFDDDVETTVNSLFNELPMSNYQSHANVFRIDVASAQCGANHPETQPVQNVNNAFGANYRCGGIDRLLCVNNQAVLNTVNSQAFLNNGGHKKWIVVLVNDPAYGGSGGDVAVAYNGNVGGGQDMTEVMKHESGHHFGGLGDEYDGGNCHAGQANISNVAQIGTPWDVWFQPPNPPVFSAVKVEAKDPACVANLFRPTVDSKMRTLGPNHGFDAVNGEQLIFRTYQAMTFPDGPAQPQDDPTVLAGAQVTFEPAVPNPDSPDMQYTWTLNGNVEQDGKGPNFRTFSPNTQALGAGVFGVEVTVADKTPQVRNPADQNAMLGTVDWNLTVNACLSRTETSTYEVQYTDSDGASCTDTHQVTDTYDCFGNLINSDDQIIDTVCTKVVTCIEVGSEIVQVGDSYTNDLGQTCHDNVKEHFFSCSDGTSYEQDEPWPATCVGHTIGPGDGGGGGIPSCDDPDLNPDDCCKDEDTGEVICPEMAKIVPWQFKPRLELFARKKRGRRVSVASKGIGCQSKEVR